MATTLVRQETQIRKSDLYNDAIAPTEAAFETNSANIEDDLNSLRSQMHNFLDVQSSNWWSDLNVPSTLETGVKRGINNLNTGLHAVEKKRVLRKVFSLVDVTVGGSANYVILGVGQLPTPLNAAVGTVTTLGTVVAAHGGTFGTHSLTEVSGTSPLVPKNLLEIVEGSTRDPILSSGRKVYGLLQGESGVVDGATITSATTTRAQISFVRINATGDDLEAVPAIDIQGKVINYCSIERVRFEGLNEADFLSGAIVDVAAGTTATRQVGYDAQGVTPVNLSTNATLDLEAPGLTWLIRDDAEASLFSIIEGSAGGTSQFNIHAAIDEFDVDAVVNNFAAGVTMRSAGTRPIAVGVTDGVVATTAGDLMVKAAAELLFDDLNQTGSTWAQDGIKLSETTAEWDNFETNMAVLSGGSGEVSLLQGFNLLYDNLSATTRQIARAKVQNGVHIAGTNITGVGGTPELTAALTDYSGMTFITDVDVYLNGILMYPAAGATEDVYPGDSAANGDLKFTFKVKGTGSSPDVITMITWG